jgi:hypothetical protein
MAWWIGIEWVLIWVKWIEFAGEVFEHGFWVLLMPWSFAGDGFVKEWVMINCLGGLKSGGVAVMCE